MVTSTVAFSGSSSGFLPEKSVTVFCSILRMTAGNSFLLPVALLILGASFRFGEISKEKRNLVIVVLGRLVVIPAVVLGTAYIMGFRGVDFVTLICIFATPCAVASFAMAQQLGSNAVLAGNSVVLSSAFSGITLFGWILLFQMAGAF